MEACLVHPWQRRLGAHIVLFSPLIIINITRCVECIGRCPLLTRLCNITPDAFDNNRLSLRNDAVSPIGSIFDPLFSQGSRYDACRLGRRCRDGSPSVRHKEQVLGLGQTVSLTSHWSDSLVRHQYSLWGLWCSHIRLFPRIFYRLIALDSRHVPSKFSPVFVFAFFCLYTFLDWRYSSNRGLHTIPDFSDHFIPLNFA